MRDFVIVAIIVACGIVAVVSTAEMRRVRHANTLFQCLYYCSRLHDIQDCKKVCLHIEEEM